MSTEKPLISFIVTVYNLEKYIDDCLDSILNQNFDDLEIVVVDNASTDSSASICQNYADKYPLKIRFYQVPKEIAVPGSAHKLGFGVSHGEYIQFIDGDDRLKGNCLSEIADTIYSKNSDIIIGRFECYLEDKNANKNNFNDAIFEAEKINDVSYDEALIYLSDLPNFQGVLWRYVFKKSLFEKSYKHVLDIFDWPFSCRIYSDSLVLMKLFYKASSIFYLDKVIYLYTRRSGGSGTGQFDFKELSNDSIRSLLNTLYFLISLKPKNGKKIYFLKKINFAFKFFKCGLNYIEKEQFTKIAKILEENIELLEGIKNCGIAELEMFYKLIIEKGYYNGLLLYKYRIEKDFINSLKNINNENLYIIPGGNKTISTVKLLKDNGYNVCAVLDNDSKKNGCIYEDVICLSPSILNQFDKTQKVLITVIISAFDQALSDILASQLNEMGIKSSQIIIKE